MVSCSEIAELATDYLEGSLPLGKRLDYWFHTFICPSCKVYFEQIRETVRKLGSLRRDDVSTATRDELTEIFRNWRDKS